MGFELSDVFITLKPREQWKRAKTQDELVSAMAQVTKVLPGMRAVYTPADRDADQRDGGRHPGRPRHQALRRRPGDAQGEGRRDRAGREEPSPERRTSRPSRSPGCRCSGSRSITRPSPATAFPPGRCSTPSRGRRRHQGRRRSSSREDGSRSSSGSPMSYREDPKALEKILIPTASGQRLPLTRLARLEETDRAHRPSNAIGASGGSSCRRTSGAATSARSSRRPRSGSTAR